MNSAKPDPDQLPPILDRVSTDLRLEVLLHELLRNGCLEPDQVRVVPRGIFNRGFLRDIGKIQVREKEDKTGKHVLFPVFREGLFDALPVGLFHQPQKRKYRKPADEISRELASQAREEEAARDFFLPVEQEYYRLRLAIEASERAIFEGYASPEGLHSLFGRLWGLQLRGVEKHQLTLLLDAITLSYSCKGWIDKTRQLYRLVMGKEVDIEVVEGESVTVPENDLPGLGETYLGMDSVAGNQFRDGLPAVRVTIPDLSHDEVTEFLPGGSQDQVLDVLRAFFLPADTAVEYRIALRQEDRQFTLGSTQTPAILGYSVYLPKTEAA